MIEKPQWVPVQELVPKNSIGARLISEIPDLGSRLRPETSLDRPFTRAKRITVLDILRLPLDISSFTHTRERLVDHLRTLTILPHNRLLSALYGMPNVPIPPGRESEVVNGVEEELADMRYQRAVPVLILRFGLYDGLPKTLKETGQLLDSHLSTARIGQIEARGMKILGPRPYRPSHRMLRLLFALPDASFGKEVFGAVLLKDIPEMDLNTRIDRLLSDWAIRELSERKVLGTNSYLEELLWHDFGDQFGRLSDQTRYEIRKVLQRRPAEFIEISRKMAEEQARIYEQAERERTAKLGEPRNNLLPQISLTKEELEILDKVSIDGLGLSVRPNNRLKRSEISTVGQLLRLGREELLNIRFIGGKSARVVGEQIGRFLNLDEETIEEIKNYLGGT